MNKPKISIIVPVYNVEKYIHRCIDSLLNQTIEEIEIILVDDGSLDDSGVICDTYAQTENRIKVIHKKNQGLGYARNSGLEMANGEFIGFIDSDDFIDSTMYNNLYYFAKKHLLDTAFSAGFKFYNNGTIKEKPEVPKESFWLRKEIKKSFIPDIIGASPNHSSDVKYAMSVCRGIYSLKQIRENNIKFVSERDYLSEDILFNLDYLAHSKNIGMMSECYYYYCYNEGSLTRSYRSDMNDRMDKLYITIKEKLQKEKLYDYAKLNLDRLYLLMVRDAIRSEFIRNSDTESRKLKLRNIFENEILADILTSYPYRLLPIKHRIFFCLLKYKVSFIFRIFADILAK